MHAHGFRLYQDWPPSSDFKDSFPALYDDFSSVVPFPDYVRRDGVLNLSSHFPANALCPDLGKWLVRIKIHKIC